MAGTCTVTYSDNDVGVKASNREPLAVIEWEWTSAADGTVSGQGSISGLTGRIDQVQFIPGDGADAPSDPHNVYLLDENGLDRIMAVGVGQGVDRTATVTIATPFNSNNSYVYLTNNSLTPSVSGAGDSKTGIIKLVVR